MVAICWICKRKFESFSQLELHERESEGHAKQAEKQLYESVHRREDVRVAVLETRQELRELDIELERTVIPPADKVQRRAILERVLRQHERQYGYCQEYVEHARNTKISAHLDKKKKEREDKAEERIQRKERREALKKRGDSIFPSGGDADKQDSSDDSDDDSDSDSEEAKLTPPRPEQLFSTKPLPFNYLELEAGVSTWQGGKDQQEDRFVIDHQLTGPRGEAIVGYAVFDGHSGYKCANYTRDKLFPMMQTLLDKDPHAKLTESYFKAVVTDTFVKADDEFLKGAVEDLLMDGTTAIVCLLWRDPDRDASDSNVKLMVANCGDSRAVLVQRSEFDTHYEKCKRYHDESGSDVKLNSALAVLSAASTSRPNGLEEFLNNDDNLNSGSDDNEQQTNFPHSNHPSIRRIQKQLQKLCHDTPADTSVRSIVSGPISGVRLSEDHKPDREDERARIQERGGMVQDMTGCSRVFTPTPLQIGQKQVQWGLAVSRSFGDLPLKKPVAFNGPVHVTDLVSVMPEITTFEMKAGRDLALILACDGIWDVLSDQDAAVITYGHMRAGEEKMRGFGPTFDGKVVTPNGSVRPDLPGAAAAADKNKDNNETNPANTFSSGTNPTETNVSNSAAYGSICPRMNNAAQQAARGLVREAWQKYSLDNLTAVVVRMKPVCPETRAMMQESGHGAATRRTSQATSPAGGVSPGGGGGGGSANGVTATASQRGPLIPGGGGPRSAGKRDHSQAVNSPISDEQRSKRARMD